MENEFVKYEQALALKELGFDEPCFGYYDNGVFIFWYDSKQETELLLNCTAPTYSQAFRWFRENCVLDSIIQPTYSTKYQYRVFNVETKCKTQVYGDYMSKEFKTYEEAELAAIVKLIEIVKGGEQ